MHPRSGGQRDTWQQVAVFEVQHRCYPQRYASCSYHQVMVCRGSTSWCVWLGCRPSPPSSPPDGRPVDAADRKGARKPATHGGSFSTLTDVARATRCCNAGNESLPPLLLFFLHQLHGINRLQNLRWRPPARLAALSSAHASSFPCSPCFPPPAHRPARYFFFFLYFSTAFYRPPLPVLLVPGQDPRVFLARSLGTVDRTETDRLKP